MVWIKLLLKKEVREVDNASDTISKILISILISAKYESWGRYIYAKYEVHQSWKENTKDVKVEKTLTYCTSQYYIAYKNIIENIIEIIKNIIEILQKY